MHFFFVKNTKLFDTNIADRIKKIKEVKIQLFIKKVNLLKKNVLLSSFLPFFCGIWYHHSFPYFFYKRNSCKKLISSFRSRDVVNSIIPVM